MYLLIDVGNTRIKWRLVGCEYGAEDLTHTGLLEDLSEFIKTLVPKQIQVVLAAVNQTAQLSELLTSCGFNKIVVTASKKSQGGVLNSYANPDRMGVDRWLAMIAAFDIVNKAANPSGIIVVDAGSALTIDVVNPLGEHQGGYIVPGVLMAQQALFSNTERVIQYNDTSYLNHHNNAYKALGKNTMQCVEYGVVNQMLALIKQVSKEYADYELFFTGGDGELLAGFLKTGIVDKDLVLKGLWQVRK